MKQKIFSFITGVALSATVSMAQEIATWDGWKKAAVTFTFDDAANEYSSHKWAVEQLNKYSFPATFYMVTNWAGSNWSNYQAFVTQGHEIGSHTVSHSSSDSELATSKNTINNNITNQKCVTIAYPNCVVPTESQVLANYIGGRICGGTINSKSPSNFARLDCSICGSSGINTTSGFTSKCQQAASSNGWVAFLIHGISGYASNGSYSPTAQDAFTGTLSWLNTNSSTYWVCTFRDAIMYIKERNGSTLKKISSDSQSETYSLTLSSELANSSICDFNYPLSIRVPVQDGWSDIAVTQNDEEIESEVSDGYVYFKAVPDGGNIVVGSAAPAVPDPSFSFQSPTSAQTWCKDSTYTISWDMSGDTNGNTYTLNWNTGSSASEISVSSVTASSEWATEDGSFSWSVDNILSDDGSHGESSRWGSKSSSDEYVVFSFSSSQTVGGVFIDEFTTYGTVSSFEIQYDDNGSWKTAYTGTTIGNDFSTTFSPVTTTKMRFYIKSATDGVNINYISFTGVSGIELKSGITGAGSYSWTPNTTGAGTITINKSNGKSLATTASITLKSCGNSTSDPTDPTDPTDPSSSTSCYDGNGYYGPSCDEEGTGAYHTGIYRNLFVEYLGKTEEQVQSKIESIWKHFFTNGSSTSVYYETSDGMAYIYDTGNSDVRTEGMSYGLMICVQLDHQAEFDKIWKWAKKYMQYKSGNDREGLFAWQCETSGSVKGSSCAPDGEAYFLTSLFFASHRWGNDGEINYEEEAQYLIKELLDKPGRSAGSISPIFHMDNHLITFGETSYGFTDPSYNLPGFLELWARWTDTNKDFWAKTAQAARDLLYNSANSTTGLYPDYSNFDGSPYYPSWAGYNTEYYKYDAIRCPMNVGMDYHWFAKDSRQKTMMSNILKFFKNDGFSHGYFKVDGTDPSGSYSEGMSGANGVGVFALDDESLAKTYVEKLWNTSAPSGQWRYYNGMVYMLSMLHASGNFKIWKPAPAQKDTTVSGKGSVDFEGETYTESTNFCYFKNCTNYNVTIDIEADGTNTADINNTVDCQIVPNPADEMFTVECNNEIESIKLYNNLGQQIKNVSNTNHLKTSSIPSGNYLVKVQTINGDTFVQKLMIKH